MKKILSKIMAIIIVIVLSIQNSLVYALTEKEELEQEQDKLNSQIEDYEKIVN